jgi:pullulanase
MQIFSFPGCPARRGLLGPVRLTVWVLGLVWGAATWAVASPQGSATRSDCDAPAPARLLQAAASAALPAQAYWVDRSRLRWPGAAPLPGAQWRLLWSARGGLRGQLGEVLQGADERITVLPDVRPLPEPLARRFAFVAPGQALRLADAELARLPALWRGQLWLVQEDAQGRALARTELQLPGALDDVYAPAAQLPDLGVQAGARTTGFKLWAPTAQAVALCGYPDGRSRANALWAARRDARSGAWSVQVARDLRGSSYTWLVDVWVPGQGLVRNRVTDPYSVSLNTNGQRSYVAALSDPALAPAGWAQDRAPLTVQAPTDMSIYELHVRDFSVSDPSVPAARRGKYTAFAELGSQGMRHLRALARAGLTDVHLLPVFDYGSVPEQGCVSPAVAGTPDASTQQAAVGAVQEQDCFNWGYDPVHYSAPEGSFASDPADGAVRVRELRQMVMALHQTGLRVGMDVVYNHTFASGQHDKSVLDRIVPGYYHRRDAQGVVERSTCCDNTATEHLMMGKLLSDSVLLWAREHHIDSFRFDLMAHQPRVLMEQALARVRRETGRSIQFIGEGWNFGEVADGRRFVQASQLSLNGSGIATFSDRGRDAVRGGSAGDSGAALMARQGYVNGLHYAPNAQAGATSVDDLRRAADLVRVGLAGSLRSVEMLTWQGAVKRLDQIDYAGQPAGYVSEPSEVVNYVENHDNQTLFDTNVMKLPLATSTEDRARVQILAAAITAFSQGVAYFHAGQDILRSKSLDRNSYNSGDGFNRLDWSYQSNHFGSGLPPQADNGADWPLMQPLLANPGLRPRPLDIAWTRDAFRDLLAIRHSSSLLRLRTAAQVRERLRFLNTGPQQEPTVLVAYLNGKGLQGAGFAELLLLINVDTTAHTLVLDSLKQHALVLHPVHLAPGAADLRARQTRWNVVTGEVQVPARTAVVLVWPAAAGH